MIDSLLFSLVLAAKHTATLNWNASTDSGTTVNVYRSTAGCSGSFQRIASGIKAGGPYTDSNLTAGVTYSYYVTAVVNKLESRPSNCVSTPITPASPSAVVLMFK